MKEEFNSSAWASTTGMKLIPDTSPGTDTAAFVQLDPGFAAITNLKYITTPFPIQPLDQNGNRILKRSADIFLSIVVIAGILS